MVAFSGRVYEALHAAVRRTRRHDLYHSAVIATLDGQAIVVEVAPVPDGDGRLARGVVGEGPVGSRWLQRFRTFRYEVRCWAGGVVPDLAAAVGGPVRISSDPVVVRSALAALEQVPTPVWGRDELGTGDMWNSNSVIAWMLGRAGLLDAAGPPPPGGRAPGWHAGVRVAGPA